MRNEEIVTKRIKSLVAESKKIVRLFSARSVGVSRCRAWIAAAISAVSKAGLEDSSPYLARAKIIYNMAAGVPEQNVAELMVELSDLLERLIEDIEIGLLRSVEIRISAETFDDIIDHAESYLEEGRKDPAAVLVGVIFEDAIRKLNHLNGNDIKGKNLDALINALKTAGVLTKLEAKEALAAAGLRNEAAHAAWDEFENEQVRSVISFTRRLIREKLV
ncbi:MAG TPA: hypothetical protein VD995_22855 [Azospirillum sp.]|nr:hypothetical protein [Azospirillum sp.]